MAIYFIASLNFPSSGEAVLRKCLPYRVVEMIPTMMRTTMYHRPVDGDIQPLSTAVCQCLIGYVMKHVWSLVELVTIVI